MAKDKSNVNENGQGDQKSADDQAKGPDVSAHKSWDGPEQHGNAEAEVRADAGSGQDSEEQSAPVTAEELEKFVETELNPLAERLGYKKIVLEAIPHNTLWPCWFYDKATKQGAVFETAADVPEGWVKNPWE